MKLLIVEDDLLLQEGLALALGNEGYALDCAATAAEADALIQSGEYSLVILDLGLPDKDGATLLCQWRRRGVENPVLILTARDAIEDRINGLDSGADDYLVKPFALAELQARVRALIRRYQGHSDNLLTDGDITLNLQTQQVLRQSQPVEVTPKEFALLTRLIMRSGQTVPREPLQTRLKFTFIICGASSVKIASKPYAAWVTVWRARNEQYAPAINGVAGGYSAIFSTH